MVLQRKGRKNEAEGGEMIKLTEGLVAEEDKEV